jgi:hypothetical protein
MSKIDGELLDKAITEVALEQIHAEIREWIMASPLTINRIYSRYLELAAQQDKKDPEL